jgi:lipooligosaccharide transport system ATP-binding protein
VDARPREVKALLGVCPQDNNLDSDFTLRRNLLVFARYYGIGAAEARRRADELIDWMQLSEKADAKVEELSGGMKRRLVLARSLLNRPKLLILATPGLDPGQAKSGAGFATSRRMEPPPRRITWTRRGAL